jgi:hypothetical protein
MDDRRQGRSTVRLPVSIHRRAAALTADVSNEGFCLETPAVLTAGQDVSGYVLHGDKELTWSGRVHWFEAGDPMLSTWHRVGVKFTSVSAGLRALLSLTQKEAHSKKRAGRAEWP